MNLIGAAVPESLQRPLSVKDKSRHVPANTPVNRMMSEPRRGISYCNINIYAFQKMLIVIAYMQVSLVKCEQFLRAVAPSGNLFLLLTLQELRRQGLTYIAFYVLQRTIEYSGSSASALRQETGLADYEISRACKSLVSSGLVVLSRDERDGRVRILRPTKLGIKVHDQVLLAAAKRLQKGFSSEDCLSIAAEERR